MCHYNNRIRFTSKISLVLIALTLAISCSGGNSDMMVVSTQNPSISNPPHAQEGMVVGTQIKEAIQAGYDTLQKGGNAVDAALVTALAQVPLNLGNFVTYAGIMIMVYYDAETEQVYSMNASWDIPNAETDPLTIPGYSLGENITSKPDGRTALVPGFMAGVGAAHERFGKLPFEDLFEPAIAFAEEGVIVDGLQEKLFADFEPVITRLPETKAIYTKEGGKLYVEGDLLRQPEMANTLRKVVSDGVDTMYTGSWGQKFVEAVQREGGVISMEDMANYEVIWSQPVSSSYYDYEIYAPGLPGFGGMSAIEAFNLLELADLRSMGHYAQDPQALFWLMQITRVNFLDYLTENQVSELIPGQHLSFGSRLNKETTEWIWDQMRGGEFPLTNSPVDNIHSAGVIAVDGEGNVVALVHTSNAYFYGRTGISVDGVYIPDPASFQQAKIAQAGPGARLPDPTNPMIVLRDGAPVYVSSCIGQVHRESLQRMVSMLDFGFDPQQAQHAPTILAPDFSIDGIVERVAAGEFDSAQLEAMRDMGQPVDGLEMTFENIIAARGLWIGVKIDPETAGLLGSAPDIFDGYVAEGKTR